MQVEGNRQLAGKREEASSSCQARIERGQIKLKQLEAELATPMAGQATAKDRETLRILQVPSFHDA